MTCFRGSALAGEDFCAPACSSDEEPGPGQVCTAEGALLPACSPSRPEPEADCPPGLNCYRLSLFEDRGVCIRMPVCSTDADCPDPLHGSCTAELVRKMVGPNAAVLPLDHLNCTASDCYAEGTGCSGGERCLASQYDPHIADICVPSCDANLHCPPNYSCAQVTSGSGASKMCFPGLPGLRCDGPHCVGGSCEDTGAGFSVCTRSCEWTADCEPLNTENDAFFCVEGGAGRHCVTPRPFHGANCDIDGDCRGDLNEFCSAWDVQGPDPPPGECRQRCKADGTCDPRGGLPHTCLWNRDGGCFPGRQGLPCTLSSECLEGLTCQDVPAELELELEPARLCTRPCGGKGVTETDADAECSPSRKINGGGFCASGFCRSQRDGGKRCSRNAQCTSGLCDAAEQTCVVKPPTRSP